MWINLKKIIWQWRGVFVVVPATMAVLLGLRLMGAFQPLELALYDLFFQWRPTESTDERIVIVTITEADIQKFSSPIPDDVLAKLINLIKQQQPRAIGLDIYRDRPVPDKHGEYGDTYQDLVTVFESTPNLIGIRKVVVNQKGGGVAASPILEKLNQVAANDFLPDGDGKIRRILLSLKDDQGKTIPSLSTALAVQYLQKENIRPEVVDSQKQIYKLGKAIFSPIDENNGGYVGQSLGGYQILSNYRNFGDNFRMVSLTDTMQGRISADLFRDRLVLIGITAESQSDYFITPYNSAILGNSFPVTTGVTLHANIASQLIANALDGRPTLQAWSKLTESLWIVLWGIISGSLCWNRRYVRSLRLSNSKFTFRLPWSVLTITGLGGGLFTASYILFLWGWWIPAVPSLLALFSSAIAVTGYTLFSTSEARKRAIVSVIPDLMFNVSGDGIYLGQINNENALESLNPDFDEIGKHLSQILPPEVSDRHLFYMQQALNTKKIQVYEQKVLIDGKSQDEEVRIVVSGINEVLFVVRDISDRKQAELALYQKNAELAAALDELKATQKQLVESEKYASLGSMVAGIAHEVNTPLGSSLMAASILDNATKSFQESFDLGELKKSSLRAYLEKAKGSSEILIANLQRAGELIKNFKQVAVDQSSLELRHFQVKDYIESILMSLEPQIKLTPHKIKVISDRPITLRSYPGALSQVVTNLVMNSLTHAYHGLDKTGQLQFELTQQDDKAIVTYTDDGQGIPAENLAKIFEPFFTTARDRGGSGLGLHIIYNLVTQNLKGTIICESAVGLGTKFIITLPISLSE